MRTHMYRIHFYEMVNIEKTRKEIAGVKNIVRFCALLLVLMLFCQMSLFLFAMATQTGSASLPLAGHVIAIDPGHGGYDAGAVGRTTGVLEKDLNLAISLQLAQLLRDAGASVILTRETDKDFCPPQTLAARKKEVDMAVRANILHESGADIVLSIHMNYISSGKNKGAQVFSLKGAKSDAGKELAHCLQSALKLEVDQDNTRKAQTGDYYILRMTDASVLVECGFLSNETDEKNLCDPDYQKVLCWGIYKGLCNFVTQGG